MEGLGRVLLTVNRVVVAAALAAVFAIVFANVVGRYVFNNSFAWVEELARHLMIFGAFCGAGLALREGRLVALELLADIMPAPIGKAIRWFGVVVMLVFMGAMAWLGAEFAAFSWPKDTMSTGMSRGIPYLAIPIGCTIFLLHLVTFAPRYVDKRFELTDEHHDEDAEPESRRP